MHSTTLRLSDDLWERVRAQAKREGLPAAHLIREALVAHMAGQRRSEDMELLGRLREDHARIAERLARIEGHLGIGSESGDGEQETS